MAATLLTRFPFIEEVFFDNNYISLTKKGMEEWEMIAADLRDYIRKYLSEGRPIINPAEIKRRQEEAQARLRFYRDFFIFHLDNFTYQSSYGGNTVAKLYSLSHTHNFFLSFLLRFNN